MYEQSVDLSSPCLCVCVCVCVCVLCVCVVLSGNANTTLRVDFTSDQVAALSWELPELAITPIALKPPSSLLSPVTIARYNLTYGVDQMQSFEAGDVQSYVVNDLDPNTLYFFTLNVIFNESAINGITNRPTAEGKTEAECKWVWWSQLYYQYHFNEKKKIVLF